MNQSEFCSLIEIPHTMEVQIAAAGGHLFCDPKKLGRLSKLISGNEKYRHQILFSALVGLSCCYKYPAEPDAKTPAFMEGRDMVLSVHISYAQMEPAIKMAVLKINSAENQAKYLYDFLWGFVVYFRKLADSSRS
ncbi:MAG: hypothetical protein ABH829_05620 [archaeon]